MPQEETRGRIEEETKLGLIYFAKEREIVEPERSSHFFRRKVLVLLIIDLAPLPFQIKSEKDDRKSDQLILQ